MMKKLIMLAILMFCLISISYAGNSTVTLEWDACTDPDVVQVNLYEAAISGGYGTTPRATILIGANEVTLTNVPNGTYFWVVTAQDNVGRESANSNEISTILDVGPGCLNFNLRFR
ncbi:MAG TPA: hypothetical protein ENH85_08180 [Candidatus Scalindua sp.]|nr:hypothetical protein [Candidatus Scalindua sp.]